jgi:uroporphyrinogen-III decarboxylase
MTPRERLFAFLRGEPTDRMPMWLLFPYHPTGYYVDVRRHPGYRRVFEASKDRAIMLDRRHLPAPVFAPEVECIDETIEEGGRQIQRRRWRCGGDELVEETRTTGDSVSRKPLLTSEADLQTLASFPIETDPRRIAAAMDEARPAYLRERAEFPERFGAMMLDLGEPIGWLYHQSNLEEYAIWSVTQPALVESILDRLMARSAAIYDYALSRALAEVYFLVGSELASPPLLSRATFQRWVVPHARRIIDMIHDAGAFAIQHYHGQIRQILPDFLTMGADALHTIEEPPVGDCRIDEAFDVVGDRLGLIGCIQYYCFRSDTPAQMQRAVREQIAAYRDKRFMLSPSAGPYEPHPDPRVIPNYLAFLEAGWQG